jgi:hypothetical protein
MSISSCLLGASRGLPDETPDFDLRPNPGPELLAPEASWELWLSLGLIGSILLLTAALLWLWLRRPRSVPSVSPYERALAELVRVEANGEDLEHRYARVADVLRQYLKARFQLQAPARTTQEFLGLLETSEHFTKEQKASVTHLLSRADLVKFARWRPTREEASEFVNSVRVLIRDASQRPL